MGTTEKMAAEHGVVQLVLKIMKSHDWDTELIEHAVPLLATITCVSRAAAARITAHPVTRAAPRPLL